MYLISSKEITSVFFNTRNVLLRYFGQSIMFVYTIIQVKTMGNQVSYVKRWVNNSILLIISIYH